MNRRFAGLGLALLFCAGAVDASPAATTVANPASAFCAQHGGRVEMRPSGRDGAQAGLCVFPDGTRIDEWVYFRNTHRTTH